MNKPVAPPTSSAELSKAEFAEVSTRLRRGLWRLYPMADRDTLEEVVQEAWTALYHHCERTGERLEGTPRLNFLYIAARNELVDRWHKARFRRTNLRGQGLPLERVGEPRAPDASPEERLVGESADREVEEIVATELTDREAAIFHLRFFEGLPHREICGRIGVSEKAVDKALTRGIDKLVGRLFRDRHWIWELGKRRMVVALLAGTASKAELAQARKLAARDPAIAQALQEAGTAVHGATVAIPAEVALRAQGQGITERVTEAVSNLGGRSDATAEAEAITAQAAASGAGRGVGAAGAGLLAKLGALGGAGKAAVACLATTGAAATCVVTGVVPGVELGKGEKHDPPAAPKVEEARGVAPTPDSVLTEAVTEAEPDSAPPPSEKPNPSKEEPTEAEPEVAQTEPGLAVPETHSEQVQQEFDLAGAGQPVSGSGGGSGGGSSGSSGGGGAKNASGRQVSQEFGP